jgi:hypothetical protein
MRTVTLGISSLEESGKRLDATIRGKKQGEFISFSSPNLLGKSSPPSGGRFCRR